MPFNLKYFGVIGGEAQGKASQRQFCYISPINDTITDIVTDNYFISQKNRLLLNDIIWVLDIKNTQNLHCLIVSELSLNYIKTKEISLPAIWGTIGGNINNQTDLIALINSCYIDNQASAFKIENNLLILQLINEDRETIFNKSLTIERSIRQNNSNLIENNAVWLELLNTANSYFKNENNKLLLRLINNNNVVLLEQQINIDNIATINSNNLIDSNAVYQERLTTDANKTYFKYDSGYYKLKLTNNNDDILLDSQVRIAASNPNYAGSYQITAASTITVPSNGWLVIRLKVQHGVASATISCNNVQISYLTLSDSEGQVITMVPVTENDTLNLSGLSSIVNMYFVPKY